MSEQRWTIDCPPCEGDGFGWFIGKQRHEGECPYCEGHGTGEVVPASERDKALSEVARLRKRLARINYAANVTFVDAGEMSNAMDQIADLSASEAGPSETEG